MLVVATAILAALACLGGSIVVIRAYDRQKLWDHLARSLVQIGIATLTVLVAFLLFKAQLTEQDNRLRLQQARSAAATLRSIIVTVGEVPKDATLLFTSVSSLDCAVQARCDAHDKDLNSTQKEELAFIYNNPQSLLLGHIKVRDEILQLIKGNYVFADRLVDLSLYASEQYERGFRDVSTKVDELRDKLRSAQNNAPNGELSTQDMAILFEKFAREQARSAQIAVTLICRLNRINEILLALKEPEAPNPTRYPPIEIGVTCPPYDESFGGVLGWFEKRG
jgi:hypothetical protein